MRITRTRDQWRDILKKQQLSGLTQTQFCRHHGITRSAFSNAKLRLAFVEAPPSEFITALPPEQATRVTINNSTTTAPVAPLSLLLPAATLCLPSDISPRWLATLLREMAP